MSNITETPEVQEVPEPQTPPKRRFRLKWPKLAMSPRQYWWTTMVLLIVVPLISFTMVEYLNYNDPWKDFTPAQILLNLVWYYFGELFFYFLRGRRSGAVKLGLGIAWGFGCANHYLIAFRGRTLFPGDFLSLGTAANVAGNYDYSLSQRQWVTLIMMIAVILAMKVLPNEPRKKFSWKVFGASAGAAVVFLSVFFGTSMVEKLGIEPSMWTTRGNGLFLNFAVCMKYMKVEKPDTYSQQTLNDLGTENASDDLSVTVVDPDGTVRPVNVIVIMNESFSDLSVLPGVETNQDAMPFIRSLTENTIKGYAYSSVFGGTTANSEYEFLTGHTTAFFSPGTIPYQMYVKPDSASLVGQMDDLGYRTIAMHPFYASGWNRPTVYADFGFDEVLFYDSFQNLSYVRSYISDQADYENIVRLYEEKEPGEKLFFFNVTMQNHSSYDQPWDNLPREVWLTGDKEGLYPTVDQYLSLLYQSDRALEYLMDYFSQVEEPTLLLVFGDHQPQVYGTFYQDMLGTDLSAADAQKKQAVPFLIWANYDIPERSGLQLSLNYLSSLLVETAGLPQTGYQQFLAGLWEDLPVVNAVGYLDGEGTWAYAPSGLSQAAQAAILDYQMLQYNEVFDRRRNLLPDFFTLP